MDSSINFDWRQGIPPDASEFVHAAGFVLAGGRSSRMGQDKALLTLGGEPLVKKAIRKLSKVCAGVSIAGGTEELRQFGRVIPDESVGCGPLGGIVAALEQSSFEWNLFLAVDAPFVPVSVLKALLFMVAGFPGVCVMARAQGVMQPLCAVYSRKALEVLKQELAAGRWKVTRAIEAA
ncbi:MAG TPA: molybdenum cofactor guanylyltransferase, partial [Edaphobacter sp.]|nr:molybdenum cofactor guanylyltransferase [Edaphobacter sp.]